jgi:hypothetical protein
MVGNRELTAAHTFAQEGLPFPPTRILVNGQMTAVDTPHHGERDAIARLYDPSIFPTAGDFLEDWVVFEVQPCAALSVPPWLAGDGRVQPGDILYAVRVDIESGTASFEATPLIVVKSDIEELHHERLVFVTSPKRENLKGWSGCFVGRYHDNLRQWELTGILICTKDKQEGDSRSLHVVLRPSTAVLDWLTGQ